MEKNINATMKLQVVVFTSNTGKSIGVLQQTLVVSLINYRKKISTPKDMFFYQVEIIVFITHFLLK